MSREILKAFVYRPVFGLKEGARSRYASKNFIPAKEQL